MQTKRVDPRIQSGFMELLPAEQILFNKYLDVIRETFEECGFVPQETPLVENSDVIFAKIGEDTKKEIYRFTKGDDDLALRFDLTVPLARYVAMRQNDLVFPFRRYQIGKVYRGERPQKGRFREFYQCDIDIIGDGKLSLVNDAEIPSVIYRLFKKLDFGEFVIRINNRKILNGLVEELGFVGKEDEVLRVVDKLEKIGKVEVLNGLQTLGIDKGSAEKIVEFVEIGGTNEEIIEKLKQMGVRNSTFSEGLGELEKVVEMVGMFGVPQSNCQVDLSIARGLSYYTGTVYETKLLNENISGSVCSGGRYDDLADSYTDKNYPGVGISIGLTRLFSQLLQAGMIQKGQATPARVLVVPLDENRKWALEVTARLREGGIKTELYTEDAKLGKKLNYANKVGVPFVVLIGSDETKEEKVTLKNMLTGDQSMVDIEEAMQMVKA